ncbi:DNA-directed RNA polymerase III subunit [Wickerhamomyces ciferrii]|uniref:DNA-directed RNA polymerase subunit n=1 Tax=Wickerhamomyces ciferrii (strain ATCC 14091 / BCRC 22168 / CBS 111 / JCM 3599 / NBRC 0793 / NRRL Y-1031 F-60-10) TaxID=1206466 RepID=K0KI77_WICCF|nr:DNA-directed RNA polymerase III subunit [Wickerhamomyces ciferrii]CCH40848.1 DNA-directed RNA polymerase III subunit [Wickerhamomyces ciferrii]
MFILSRLSDLIRIPPDQFNKEPKKALLNELHKKYSNKIIQNLGFVVSVWDLIKIDDGLLKPGDGGSYIKCIVRVIVFRPFVGEILTGWIDKCTPDGLKIKMAFFDDIFIPKAALFEGCEFSLNDNAWIWNADGAQLYLDVNEKIRFRVEQEIFRNVKPKGPTSIDGTVITNDDDEDNDNENAEKPSSYAILGSCQADGMGLVSWWD